MKKDEGRRRKKKRTEKNKKNWQLGNHEKYEPRRKPNKIQKNRWQRSADGRTATLQNWHTCGCCVFIFGSGFRLVAPKPLEKLCFRVDTKRPPRIPLFMEKQKTLDVSFSNFLFRFLVELRGRNPCFRRVSWGYQKKGFNYSPLNCQQGGSIKHLWAYIYIYICIYVCLWVCFMSWRVTPLSTFSPKTELLHYACES